MALRTMANMACIERDHGARRARKCCFHSASREALISRKSVAMPIDSRCFIAAVSLLQLKAGAQRSSILLK